METIFTTAVLIGEVAAMRAAEAQYGESSAERRARMRIWTALLVQAREEGVALQPLLTAVHQRTLAEQGVTA